MCIAILSIWDTMIPNYIVIPLIFISAFIGAWLGFKFVEYVKRK